MPSAPPVSPRLVSPLAPAWLRLFPLDLAALDEQRERAQVRDDVIPSMNFHAGRVACGRLSAEQGLAPGLTANLAARPGDLWRLTRPPAPNLNLRATPCDGLVKAQFSPRLDHGAHDDDPVTGAFRRSPYSPLTERTVVDYADTSPLVSYLGR